ncbi:Nn.00g099230.m01.CDS01 [Neocucurbitaria sp. VM-36]
MEQVQRLKKEFPWIQTPLVVGAPMRLIALADMAVEISKAGGIGFIGAGTDVSDLSSHLQSAQALLQHTSLPTVTTTTSSPSPTLPIGIGFINWGADLSASIPLIAQYRPAAVWFFAPSSPSSLAEWTQKSREACPETKVWVQVGSVAEALDAYRNVKPDVLVVQGTDAGGHGLAQGASIVSLVPEVSDAVGKMVGGVTSDTGGSGGDGEEQGHDTPILLAAGGIADARGAAAALLLGAAGIVLGTRFLASHEANISRGYQAEVLRAADGGQTTVRTKVYDRLRGTNWAETHNARGIVNRSYVDAMGGMDEEENKRLYGEEMERGDEGWGVESRMTTYAGSAVGLVKEVKGAGEIVREVREGVKRVLEGVNGRL